MSNDPWYSAFLGVDYRQGRAIGRVATAHGRLDDRIDELERDNARLEAAVQRLDTVVRVLGSHLVTRGVVDGEQIANELKRALEPEQLAEPQDPSGSPYRGAVPARVVPSTAVCAGCNLEVLRDTTQFSERGVLCEDCFRAEELKRLSKLESE